MFMGRKCLQKRNNRDSSCYFHTINVRFLHGLRLFISQYSKRYRYRLNFVQNYIVCLPITDRFVCIQYHVILIIETAQAFQGFNSVKLYIDNNGDMRLLYVSTLYKMCL